MILAQTFLEIFDGLISCRTNERTSKLTSHNAYKWPKVPPPTALGRISSERLSEDHEILHAYGGRTARPTNLSDMMSLSASDGLKTAVIEHCM